MRGHADCEKEAASSSTPDSLTACESTAVCSVRDLTYSSNVGLEQGQRASRVSRAPVYQLQVLFPGKGEGTGGDLGDLDLVERNCAWVDLRSLPCTTVHSSRLVHQPCHQPTVA